MFNQNNPVEAINKYVGILTSSKTTPWLTVRRPSLSILKEWLRIPVMRIHFKSVIAEGNYAVLHCL
jgi:hypothetical protein